SPYRVVESLRELAAAWGDPPSVLGRELTKLHEEVLRGRASEIAETLAARPGIKGEIVIAAAARGTDSGGSPSLPAPVRESDGDEPRRSRLRRPRFLHTVTPP